MGISNPGVPPTRQVIAGTGLTGGGPLTSDVTLNASGGGSDASLDIEYFGNGIDGDLTISAGTTTLTRDTYYNDVTITGTGSINTNGFRLFVNGILDLSAAPNKAIYAGLNAGSRNGGNGNLGFGGPAGFKSVSASGTLGEGGGDASAGGGAGGTGAGQVAAAASSPSECIGGVSGAGGKGGNCGANAGGASRAATAFINQRFFNRLAINPVDFRGGTVTKMNGGGSGPGGSSGGGSGVDAGGAGGGGGGGGAILYLGARTINRSGSTAAGAINATGGNGGNGQNGNGANSGGGGGGAGGGGGWAQVVYRFLAGSTATNIIDASGGIGGSGGNGVGTGLGADSGQAGGAGFIMVSCLDNGLMITQPIGAAIASNPASGITGGALVNPASQKLSL